MKKIIVNWILSTLAILITAYLLPGIGLENLAAAFIAALVLGILNAIVRPILLILTLPLNVLTLGLFTFIINAMVVSLAASLVPGFKIASFGWALLFSIILSLVNMGINRFRKE